MKPASTACSSDRLSPAALPHHPMPAIEPLRVGAMESPKAATEIGLWSFNQQVIVIPHQAIDIAAPLLLADFVAQQAEELLSVGIV